MTKGLGFIVLYEVATTAHLSCVSLETLGPSVAGTGGLSALPSVCGSQPLSDGFQLPSFECKSLWSLGLPEGHAKQEIDTILWYNII